MARKYVEYTSGIYCWTSLNGKKYIGKSKKLEFRKKMFLKFNRDYTGGISKIDIARKVFGDSGLIPQIINRGLLYNPVNFNSVVKLHY